MTEVPQGHRKRQWNGSLLSVSDEPLISLGWQRCRLLQYVDFCPGCHLRALPFRVLFRAVMRRFFLVEGRRKLEFFIYWIYFWALRLPDYCGTGYLCLPWPAPPRPAAGVLWPLQLGWA
ncbi:hypothetical protein AAFF_G00111750 [Aldrovandia affinis]|uniref:Uncharacterized protein n=1 Tax=Aldrovandia affinis TaxID=143900 RepID=A0AAD7WBN4_9TELE|nr:hypothetical protein AAFF_G00111750 [Aldrovandia affinis]